MGYIGAGPTRFNTADELTVTGDAEFNGDLTVKGTHITLDSATVQTVDLGDNDKIRLGDGDDLQIYHDGSDSFIKDTGTGQLWIASDDYVGITNSAANEFKARFNTNGSVQLYYDNAEKLATTATGVDVTGGLGLTSTGVPDVSHNTTATGAGSLVGRTLYRWQGTDVAQIRVTAGTDTGNHDDASMSFFTSDGTFAERMVITSAGNVGIGTSSPDETVQVFQTANSGNNYNQGTLKVGGSTTALGFQFGYHGISSGRNVITSLNDAGGSNQRISIGFGAVDSSGEPATNVMTLNQSGSVGIGTSSPSGKLNLATGATTTCELRLTSNNTGSGAGDRGRIVVYSSRNDGTAYEAGKIEIDRSTGTTDEAHMIFATNGGSGNTERLRITSSGSVGISKSAYGSISTDGFWVENGSWVHMSGTGTSPLYLNRNGSDGGIVNFYKSGTIVGSISVTGSSTAYNTSSDYRLKENVTADWDATTRLKQLNPVRFNFIADADTTVDGFLAHEVQDVVPEAISGTKDGMRDEEYQVSAATGDIYTPAIEAVLDEDGNEVTPAVAEVIHSTDVERPEELAEGQQWRETTAAVMGTRSVPDYQGIDQSKLVPLLVKTIQELEARIVALETA